jgi:hypothetical protein
MDMTSHLNISDYTSPNRTELTYINSEIIAMRMGLEETKNAKYHSDAYNNVTNLFMALPCSVRMSIGHQLRESPQRIRQSMLLQCTFDTDNDCINEK